MHLQQALWFLTFEHSFLLYYTSKLHVIHTRYSKQFFYQIWGLLPQPIKFLQCLKSKFFYIYYRIYILIFTRKLLLCIYLQMKETMFQKENSLEEIYQLIMGPLHLLPINLLNYLFCKFCHKYQKWIKECLHQLIQSVNQF